MKETKENYVLGAFLKSGYDKNLNPNAGSFIPAVPSLSNAQISSKNTKENYLPGAFLNSGYDTNLNPNAGSFIPAVLSLSNTQISSKTTKENYVPGAFLNSGYGNNNNINVNARSFIPLPGLSTEQISSKNSVEESIKAFMYEQLCKYGPMKDSDSRLSFESYSGYLCLKRDAEKAKKQSMETSLKWPNLEAFPIFRSEGVQTYFSGFDIDADDPCVLQQNNELLAEELQTVSEKLAVLQEKSKLKQREQSTQMADLESENLVLEFKVHDLKETIKQTEQILKEAKETQIDLRMTKASFDATYKKNVDLERELKEVKKNLEEEQKVSFNIQQKVNQIREKEDTIRFLKLECLKSDFERKTDCLSQRRQDNELLIEYLGRMSNAESSSSASSAVIRDAMDKLNAFSASLYSSLETLRVRYEERKHGIETAPASHHHTEDNFEVCSIDSPSLDSLELNTLRLLVTANFYTNFGSSQVNHILCQESVE